MIEIADQTKWAIILSHHLSGYSVVKGLQEAGWGGKVLVLKINHSGPALCDQLSSFCEVKAIEIEQPADLFREIDRLVPKGDIKHIFFFDERYHRVFKKELKQPSLKNAFFRLGSVEKLDVILDRFEFYRKLSENKLALVPDTISSKDDSWKHFHGPFFFRFRETWKGMVRNPRNHPIYKACDLHKQEEELFKKGHQRDEWCFQELLSVADKDNVSICGWHDPHMHEYIATRNVLQHPPKNGNGDVVERIDPPEGLIETTRNVLDYLEFDGPFELEYVYDGNSRQFKAIELNPRFWLQHSLCAACTGNILVKRYVGTENGNAGSANAIASAKYWINTNYFFLRIVKLDPRIYPYLFKQRLNVPLVADSTRFIVNSALHIVKDRMRRTVF